MTATHQTRIPREWALVIVDPDALRRLAGLGGLPLIDRAASIRILDVADREARQDPAPAAWLSDRPPAILPTPIIAAYDHAAATGDTIRGLDDAADSAGWIVRTRWRDRPAARLSR